MIDLNSSRREYGTSHKEVEGHKQSQKFDINRTLSEIVTKVAAFGTGVKSLFNRLTVRAEKQPLSEQDRVLYGQAEILSGNDPAQKQPSLRKKIANFFTNFFRR